MTHFSNVLADKLILVLREANRLVDESEVLTRDDLAQTLADAQHEVFSYMYRAAAGDVRQGYVTASTIRRYISFLEDIELLDEGLHPMVERAALNDRDRMINILADTAKEYLSENGISVDSISAIAKEILRDDTPTLPSVDDIYSALDTDLAQWRFKWLVNLYSLGGAALTRYRQVMLLLPREYSSRT